MNYGAELIKPLALDIKKQYQNKTVKRIEGAADWCALTFGPMPSLFISWNPQHFGASQISPQQARSLTKAQDQKISFLQALSKHILSASLIHATQLNDDRILALTFERFIGGGISKQTTLLAEFMGRFSNLILLDKDHTILEVARHIHPDVNRYRTIIPSLPYTPPPPIQGTKPLPTMADDQLRQALTKPIGISKNLSLTLLEELEKGNSTLVRQALAESDDHPYILQQKQNFLTACHATLPGWNPLHGSPLQICQTFTSDAIQNKIQKNITDSAQKILQKHLGRKRKHLDDLKTQLERSGKAEDMRISGQAILDNLNTIGPKRGQVQLTAWLQDGPKQITVNLDPTLDPTGNAKKYFKLYNKYKTDTNQVQTKIDAIQTQIEDATQLLDNLQKTTNPTQLTEILQQIQQEYNLSPSKNPKNKTKKSPPPPPHLRYHIDNSIILVGLNEKGNRHVTFKEAGPDDLWFHVHDLPGSHVILKNPPSEETDQPQLQKLITFAASLAAYYSKGQQTNLFVDYTRRKHVKHIQGSGPANVTYKNSKSIQVPKGPHPTLED